LFYKILFCYNIGNQTRIFYMKRLLLVVILLFISIQFIPYGLDHTNPPQLGKLKWDSNRTQTLFMRACGDCHSNRTQWEWYSSIAPLSWGIYKYIQDGREQFNISMWGVQDKNSLEKAIREIKEEKMPITYYLWTHPEAKLSSQDKEFLILGLIKTREENKTE